MEERTTLNGSPNGSQMNRTSEEQKRKFTLDQSKTNHITKNKQWNKSHRAETDEEARKRQKRITWNK